MTPPEHRTARLGERLCYGLYYRAGFEQEFYTRYPEVYDRVMAHRRDLGRRIAEAALKLTNKQQFDTALDMACGTGLIVEGLRDHVRGPIYGIDVLQPMLDVARSKQIPQTEFVQRDVNDLTDVPDEEDLITIVGGLRFVNDLEQFHHDMRRLLSPDGLAAVCYTDIPLSDWAEVHKHVWSAGLKQVGSLEARGPGGRRNPGCDETTVFLRKQ